MSFLGRLATHGLLILWTLLALVPFVLIILLAFRDNSDIYAHPLAFGGTWHPENFIAAWNGLPGSPGMSVFLGNSALALLSALVVNLAFGSAGAYFLTQLPRKVSSWYLGLFIGATVVPFVLILVPIYSGLDALGLLNNPLALGVVYGALNLPFTILILNAFFVDFPKELVEAAKIDGLGTVMVFARIVLPLSKSALTAVGVLLAVGVWSETQLAIVILTDSAQRTAAVGILAFQSQYTSNLGVIFAGLTLISIPVIAIYLIFNRFITKGLALGGVSR